MKSRYPKLIVFFIFTLSFCFQINQAKAQIYDVLLGIGSDIVSPASPSTQSSLDIGNGYYGNIQAYFTPNIGAQIGLDVKAYRNTPYINLYLGGVLRPSQLDTEIMFPFFSYGFGATNTLSTIGFHTFGEVGFYITGVTISYHVGYYAGDILQSVRFGYSYYFNL